MSDTQTPRTKAKIKENLGLLMDFLRGKYGSPDKEVERMLFNALDWTANDVAQQSAHPGLGSGALREALEQIASITCSCHDNRDVNWHGKRCPNGIALAALSLSSPIEPCEHDKTDLGHVHTIAEAQASSEIREALGKIVDEYDKYLAGPERLPTVGLIEAIAYGGELLAPRSRREMSLECSECEHDLRGGHAEGCSHYVRPCKDCLESECDEECDCWCHLARGKVGERRWAATRQIGF